MKYFTHLAVTAALVLTGCATSPKTFYADRSKANDTSLCRVLLDAGPDPQYRADVVQELLRRGMTPETCAAKVNTQDAVILGAALVGLGTAAVIACSNASCGGGGLGGGTIIDKDCYGGRGDNPVVHGPVWVGTYDPDHLDADHDGWGCEPTDRFSGA
jgi:hypothetical protein